MEPQINWWTKAKTLQELVAAKKENFESEAATGEAFLKGLVTDGSLSQHECDSSIRRQKVKGMKYEWDGFLSATSLTSGLVEDLEEKRKTLDDKVAKEIALVLECPKEVVMAVVNKTPVAKGETVAKDKKDAKPVEKEEVTVEVDEGEEESSETEEGVEEDTEGEASEEGEEEGVAEVSEGEAEHAESAAEPVDEPAPKKRGRPLGSKNKPRDDSGDGDGKAESKPAKPVKPAKVEPKPAAKPPVEKPAAKPTPAAKPAAKPVARPAGKVPAKELAKEPRSKEEFAERFGSSKQPVSRKHALMRASSICSLMAAQWGQLKDVFEELAITDGE